MCLCDSADVCGDAASKYSVRLFCNGNIFVAIVVGARVGHGEARPVKMRPWGGWQVKYCWNVKRRPKTWETLTGRSRRAGWPQGRVPCWGQASPAWQQVPSLSPHLTRAVFNAHIHHICQTLQRRGHGQGYTLTVWGIFDFFFLLLWFW